MQNIEFYQQAFKDYLDEFAVNKEPVTLYEPINYILKLGGKRLRPVLTLMASELYDTSYKKALDAALAIEVFHNFSLIHDDIMDGAPLRRGQQTVHEKWNLNTGILSGDAMLILAYQLFENYKTHIFRDLAQLFSKTALEVCEGQQYDIDFETRTDVTIDEYLKMIEYKTAVLVGAALKMGAIIAGASKKDQEGIYDFGRNLGIAFQLQDDYLDAFGNPELFGKQVGGDILENKKTYLFLKALELGSAKQQEALLRVMGDAMDPEEKIKSVTLIFEETGAKNVTLKTVESYTNKAFSVLEDLNLSTAKKEVLKAFGNNLMTRKV